MASKNGGAKKPTPLPMKVSQDFPVCREWDKRTMGTYILVRRVKGGNTYVISCDSDYSAQYQIDLSVKSGAYDYVEAFKGDMIVCTGTNFRALSKL